MTRMIRRLTISLLALTTLTGQARSDPIQDHWPTWRGPLGSGVSPTGNPPLVWSETQNIRWKAPVPGKGTSSPVVWGDRIFFLTAIETDREGTP
ncbi:MAG: PQQ-binding-like beta-propeller repeat protein, partial [Phycisphaerales bacterium]